MNHGPNILSIVELDPQALLTIGAHIVKKCCIHYDVRWAARSVGLLFVFSILKDFNLWILYILLCYIFDKKTKQKKCVQLYFTAQIEQINSNNIIGENKPEFT